MNLSRVCVFALLLAGVSSAATVNWTGPSDFDNGVEITFAGFTANKLVSINADTAYMHNHGNTAVIFGLDIQLDGIWTNIDTFQPPDGGDYSISVFGPATFSTGTVTGLRFTESILVSNGFHGFDSDASFTFDASAVPEPATFLLIPAALAGLLIRKRTAASRL